MRGEHPRAHAIRIILGGIHGPRREFLMTKLLARPKLIDRLLPRKLAILHVGKKKRKAA